MSTDVKIDQDIEQLLKEVSDEAFACRLIMFNDDHHSMMEVVDQVRKAIKCTREQAMRITLTAHTKGEAVVMSGSFEECEAAGNILQQIDLAIDIIQ